MKRERDEQATANPIRDMPRVYKEGGEERWDEGEVRNHARGVSRRT